MKGSQQWLFIIISSLAGLVSQMSRAGGRGGYIPQEGQGEQKRLCVDCPSEERTGPRQRAYKSSFDRYDPRSGKKGIAWQQGVVGGVAFSYVLPKYYITSFYGGYYPYWGYGLGYDDQLVALAKEDLWEDIIQKLVAQQTIENVRLAASQSSANKNRQQILEIQNRLAKIQLHLDGLIHARKY